MAIYIAYGNANTILTSPDGNSWTLRHQDIGFQNCVLDVVSNGAGTPTLVAVGGGNNGNSFFYSTNAGVSWQAVNTGGKSLAFGFGGFLVYGTSGQLVYWDSANSQFVAVGQNTVSGHPVVCTSPDGITWAINDITAIVNGQFLTIAKGAGLYVAICWFGGIGSSTPTTIYSSPDLATWTARHTTAAGGRQYASLKWNGSVFVTVSVAGTGITISSPDGLTWAETASGTAPTISPYYGIDKECIWDASTSLWILTSLGPVSANGGIFTSGAGTSWTESYTNPNSSGAYAGSVVRAGSRLVAFMSGQPTGSPPQAPLLQSTNGTTWTPTGGDLDSQYVAVLWDGSQFVGYRLDAAGILDNQIATSPDGVTWTNRYDDSAADILNIALFTPPVPPPPVPLAPETGPRKAIVYSLARQVFEPIQEFANTVRSAVIESAQSGVTWEQLTNAWSTYLAPWDSFATQNQVGVFLGVDDGTQTTWNDLPNAWSTYSQTWNSFPAGGNVDLFSDNSTTDAGLPIPYSMVPALIYESSRQNILLDSWDFILKIAPFFELLTIEFDALPFALGNPIPITATPIDLSDSSTFSTPKAYPGPQQNRYARYIRVTLSGNSYYRAFAFGGATIFVQIQERPSTAQPQS